MFRVKRKSYLSFCFANMLNYGISLILWPPFSLKTLLEESCPAQPSQVRRAVDFAGKLLRVRSSRKRCDKCLSLFWHKKSIRDKHSNESGNWFFKSSIPGALSTVLENFRPRFSQPDWLLLGLRGYNRNNQHRKESSFFTMGWPVT